MYVLFHIFIYFQLANGFIKDCIQRLDEQFPKSPRVEVLQGQRIETKDLSLAVKYYQSLLENDESNVVRLISILSVHWQAYSLIRDT